MKILIVSDYWQPLHWDKYSGGAESYNMSVWKALLKMSDVDAWMLTTNDVGFNHEKLKTWPDPSKETFAKSNPNNRYIPGANIDSVIPWIKEQKFDALLTSCTSVKLIRKLAQAETPIVHISHTVVVYRNDPERFKALNEIKKSMRYKAITVSDYAMKNINKSEPGYIDTYLHPTYIEPPVLTEFDSFIPNKLVYTGRVVKTKHLDTLLECYAGSKYAVFVVGDEQHHSGSEYEWFLNVFKPAIERYPNIRHIQNMPHDQLFPFIYKCAGLIVPCYDESYSLSAFEAQCLGVPVLHIMNKRPGSVEEYMIDGKTGIVVETYRKRKNRVREDVLNATEKLVTLPRQEIYNHFRSTYSEKKFVDSLLNIIKSV